MAHKIFEAGVDFKRWALPLCIRSSRWKDEKFAYIVIEILCFYFYLERWEL